MKEPKFINSIKEFRTTLGMRQEDLADKLGITRQTIIALEQNKYLPSLDLAFKLSKLFKVRIEEIFQEV